MLQNRMIYITHVRKTCYTMDVKEILCKTCNYWVDCGEKEAEAHGFCLLESLFTYTKRSKCRDYEKGKPMDEDEWELMQG